jgi:hypothetical protein
LAVHSPVNAVCAAITPLPSPANRAGTAKIENKKNKPASNIILALSRGWRILKVNFGFKLCMKNSFCGLVLLFLLLKHRLPFVYDKNNLVGYVF